MRHAICVIGYGETQDVLQKDIEVLDSKNIDFFIHWDARYKLPKLQSHYSSIFFVKDRIRVNWGSDSQIKATLKLLIKVKKSKKKYDYVHLISSSDIPLMTVEYFTNYFKKEMYVGFSSNIGLDDLKYRIGYYYPNIDFRRHRKLATSIVLINKLLGVNRLKNIKHKNIRKGPNWFSMKSKYINKILSYQNKNIFFHSCCADELFLQTIFQNFENNQLKSKNDNEQALRYIDWDRGNPYIFTKDDVYKLKKLKNTNFAFARKVENAKLVDLIFN